MLLLYKIQLMMRAEFSLFLAAFLVSSLQSLCLAEWDEFPQLFTDSQKHTYFNIKRGYRRLSGKVKELQVSDDIDCAYQCAMMKEECVAVNVQKNKLENGLRLCELFKDKPKNKDLIPNGQFTYISIEDAVFADCADIYKIHRKISGVYHINPIPSLQISAYCDMETSGGGWTIIQKRQDGSIKFNRDWDDYKRGFGNKFTEYWLGLDTIHSLTSQGAYKLRIDMEDFDGNLYNASYDSIGVSNETDGYRLSLGTFKGNIYDGMEIHKKVKFSTWDRDNDYDEFRSCAALYKGGWWYNKCFHSNLNGQYGSKLLSDLLKKSNNDAGFLVLMLWTLDDSKPEKYALMKRVEMKIRPKDF